MTNMAAIELYIKEIKEGINDIKYEQRTMNKKMDDTIKDTITNTINISKNKEDINEFYAKINVAKEETKKDMKLWLYGGVATGLTAILISVVSRAF